MGKLFGTDGIRGEANKPPMDITTIFRVGQAVAYLFRGDSHHAKVIIGKDTRLSGYMIEGALETGITSMGGDVYLTGVIPTPGIAFITGDMRADAGIVISASHNPFQDNGIKIFSSTGYKLPDETESRIEELVFSEELDSLLPEADRVGKAYRVDDAQGRYIVFLKHTFPKEISIEGLKVVMDLSNGATYKGAPHAFTELGAVVDTIYGTPDGVNINLNCGSQHPEALAKRVVEADADIGLAFDGDGDRLIAVDEKGGILTGDQILLICASTLKKENRLRNNTLVSTVMSNIGQSIACKKLGIIQITSKVGDRYVLEDMLKYESIIGGEDSGHIIFLEHHSTGDGIITALQLITSMVKEGKSLSELAKIMDVYPQELINVTVEKKPDIDSIPSITEAIKDVESSLGSNGRVLVRYSGTQPMLRVMVEGPNKKITHTYCKQIAEAVKEAIGKKEDR